MGMTTRIVGIRPADDRWKKMYNVYKACEAAGINPPKQVDEFFGVEEPHPRGVIVNIDKCIRTLSEDTSNIFEIELKDLPDGIKVIRFSNDY